MSTAEQTALRELVADVAAEVDESAVWDRIVDLGLDGIGVPESCGGSGGTLADLAIVADGLAAAGVGTPLIESATARWVLAGAHVECRLPIVVIVSEATDRIVVPWGRSADLIVAYTGDGAPVAYKLDPAIPTAVVAESVNVAGEPRDVIALSGLERVEIPTPPSSHAATARVAVLWSAALTGAMRGAYLRTRDHVRIREQFGVPLIRIPAVASALANFRTHLTLAEAAVARAIDSAAEDDPDLDIAATARVIAATSATEGARLAHQLHGAIGITNEAGLHRLTTRLWAWQDAVSSERTWARHLGEEALTHGEDHVWSRLTAHVR